MYKGGPVCTEPARRFETVPMVQFVMERVEEDGGTDKTREARGWGEERGRKNMKRKTCLTRKGANITK